MKNTLLLALAVFAPGWLWAGGSAPFNKDLAAFYQNPRDLDLQEKVIQDALALKSAPALPVTVARLKKEGEEAVEKSQFKEASQFLLEASEWAPWNAGLYSDLAQPQEKAGLYPEALQSLGLYLMAAPDADDRAQVQDRIKKLGDENKQWITDQIKHLDDVSVTNSLATRIVEMGPAAKAEAVFLVQALKNNDQDIRANAAFVLGQIRPLATGVLPALADRLDDPQTVVRESVSGALSKVGPAAVQVLPDLIDSLKDDDEEVRNNAAVALGNIGAAAAKAVPALVKALKDGSSKTRGNAASALGKIGPSAKEALPALEILSNDHDPVIKKNAAEAVKQINSTGE